jgi:hypothetical protein
MAQLPPLQAELTPDKLGSCCRCFHVSGVCDNAVDFFADAKVACHFKERRPRAFTRQLRAWRMQGQQKQQAVQHEGEGTQHQPQAMQTTIHQQQGESCTVQQQPQQSDEVAEVARPAPAQTQPLAGGTAPPGSTGHDGDAITGPLPVQLHCGKCTRIFELNKLFAAHQCEDHNRYYPKLSYEDVCRLRILHKVQHQDREMCALCSAWVAKGKCHQCAHPLWRTSIVDISDLAYHRLSELAAAQQVAERISLLQQLVDLRPVLQGLVYVLCRPPTLGGEESWELGQHGPMTALQMQQQGCSPLCCNLLCVAESPMFKKAAGGWAQWFCCWLQTDSASPCIICLCWLASWTVSMSICTQLAGS